jgi:16S rRNA (guanine527-N7)-methyltransferase
MDSERWTEWVRLSQRDLAERLRRRARKAGLDPGRDLVQALERYYQLLRKWNAKINLTSLPLSADGTDDAIDRLLIEPLIAARHVPSGAIQALDIGSGGGSPAIPMALAMPTLHVRLVESKTRKAVFLREAIRDLQLGRALVEATRFEGLLARPDLHEGVDLLTIRAVKVDPRTLLSLQSFVKPGGQVFLFRGAGGTTAVETMAPPLSWVATYPLVSASRSRLVVLQKSRLTLP